MKTGIPRVIVGVAVAAATLGAQTPAPSNSDQFYLAIRAGDQARVAALAANVADVNASERRGGATPLMHTAAFGSLEAMRLLIDKGADVNTRSAAGATALMWAATDLAKVRLLVERGADVNAVSDSGRTVMHLAAMSDSSAPIVQFLHSRGAKADVVDKEGMTTLLAATVGNDTATIKQLVEAGVNVNAAGFLGLTPLMNAAGQGNLEAVRLLLGKGANVNAVSGPPDQKVQNGIIDLGQFTPLILAGAQGPVGLVKALLDAGANIDAQEARGMTALMYAVTTDHGDIEIAKTLISRGANVHLKSNAGETAANWTRKSGSVPLLALLQRSGGTPGPMAAHSLPEAAPTTIRPAIERSVALLERSSGAFFVNSACGACHAQNITDVAIGAARTAGLPVNNAGSAQRSAGASAAFAATATRLLERFDGPTVDILLYTMAGFAAAGHTADRATDAMAVNVAAQQTREGHWHSGGVVRPPMEDGDYTRTALGVRALAAYGIPGRAAEMQGRVARGVTWLKKQQPSTAEDRGFRLLGLAWGNADEATRRRAAADILKHQRPDGGWGQRDEMASDAYATGLTMYALQASGSLANADAAMRRGAAYLLSTQRADGSWFVASRSPKFQPYFEGGFPYGPNQWISSMATGWAAAALAGGLQGGLAN